MCGYVPGDVLRQCSAANLADIYVPSVRSLHRSFMYTERSAQLASSSHVYVYLVFPKLSCEVIA